MRVVRVLQIGAIGTNETRERFEQQTINEEEDFAERFTKEFQIILRSFYTTGQISFFITFYWHS